MNLLCEAQGREVLCTATDLMAAHIENFYLGMIEAVSCLVIQVEFSCILVAKATVGDRKIESIRGQCPMRGLFQLSRKEHNLFFQSCPE